MAFPSLSLPLPTTPSSPSIFFADRTLPLHSPPFIGHPKLVCRRPLSAVASLRDAEELVKAGVVRLVHPTNAHLLLSQEDFAVLDVRPIWERERSFVTGSTHVPLFIEDEDPGFVTLVKKGIQMGYGGVWMGQRLTTRNDKFLEQVQATFPRKDEKLILACGEGLRSLLAAEELYDSGYINLAWIDGGLNKVQDGNFPDVQGSTKLQYASMGGAAEYILKFSLVMQSLINRLGNSKKP